MNAAIRAIDGTAGALGIQVTGIRHGYVGLLRQDFISLRPADVTNILHRGGTILLTARCHGARGDRPDPGYRRKPVDSSLLALVKELP